MNYTIDRTTPKDAPYEVGQVYKTNGQPVDVPICRVCRGELIGREIPRGICGADDRRTA